MGCLEIAIAIIIAIVVFAFVCCGTCLTLYYGQAVPGNSSILGIVPPTVGAIAAVIVFAALYKIFSTESKDKDE